MSKGYDRRADKGGAEDLKPYAKPTLTRGPVLSEVSADSAASAEIVAPVSDIRLKRDIRPVGRTGSGLTLYRFRYLWSDVEMVGVMAQEVLEAAPQAVFKAPDGYYRVDYARLGLRFLTYAAWRGEAPAAAA